MHAPDFNHASAISPRRLQLFVARTFRQRLQGLHAYPKLSWHTGLSIRPCNAIHTFGLTYAIEVICLDRRGRHVKRVDRLLPWRVAIGLKDRKSVESGTSGSVRGEHGGLRSLEKKKTRS